MADTLFSIFTMLRGKQGPTQPKPKTKIPTNQLLVAKSSPSSVTSSSYPQPLEGDAGPWIWRSEMKATFLKIGLLASRVEFDPRVGRNSATQLLTK